MMHHAIVIIVKAQDILSQKSGTILIKQRIAAHYKKYHNIISFGCPNLFHRLKLRL